MLQKNIISFVLWYVFNMEGKERVGMGREYKEKGRNGPHPPSNIHHKTTHLRVVSEQRIFPGVKIILCMCEPGIFLTLWPLTINTISPPCGKQS